MAEPEYPESDIICTESVTDPKCTPRLLSIQQAQKQLYQEGHTQEYVDDLSDYIERVTRLIIQREIERVKSNGSIQETTQK